jgi:hypothetical protein
VQTHVDWVKTAHHMERAGCSTVQLDCWHLAGTASTRLVNVRTNADLLRYDLQTRLHSHATVRSTKCLGEIVSYALNCSCWRLPCRLSISWIALHAARKTV